MEEMSFKIANNVALLGWAVLVFAPNWRGTYLIVHRGIVPILLSGAYLVFVAMGLGDSEGNFGSLSGVFMLFQNKTVLLAGWVHYLAFDLLVGAWIQRDSKRRGIRHLYIVPLLVFTFMLGPVGYLLYRALRLRYPEREVLE